MLHRALIVLVEALLPQPDEHDGILGVRAFLLLLTEAELELSPPQIDRLLDLVILPFPESEGGRGDP